MLQRSSSRSAAAENLDDFECSICVELLYEPYTGPCGHSFCRRCAGEARCRDPRCPTCRASWRDAPANLPVSSTLATAIQRIAPAEYAARAAGCLAQIKVSTPALYQIVMYLTFIVFCTRALPCPPLKMRCTHGRLPRRPSPPGQLTATEMTPRPLQNALAQWLPAPAVISARLGAGRLQLVCQD